tara:strand:- start:104830 stop:105708 length:879 start_codon:yes stop_codon:yes gene_type:complete
MAFQNCGSEMKFAQIEESVVSSEGEDGSPPVTVVDDEIPRTPEAPEDPFNEEEDTPGVIYLPILDEWASMAFEDNVARPDAGDRDYNDAVFNYRVAEQYNQYNQLIRIFIELRVREKISGNNHRLHLYLNGDPTADFSNISTLSSKAIPGKANVTMTLPDGNIEYLQNVDHFVVVPETSGSKGDIYQIQLDLIDMEEPSLSEVRNYIDFRRYRFILQNHGQNMGIDLSEINSSDEMLATDGYPLGFMIPTDWAPPSEGQLIDNKYPNFEVYRSFLLDPNSIPIDDAYSWFEM